MPVSSSRADYTIMQVVPRRNAYPDFPIFDGAVWLQPELVCTVSFMQRTPGGGLRQPSFKGLRDDKTPEECTGDDTA